MTSGQFKIAENDEKKGTENIQSPDCICEIMMTSIEKMIHYIHSTIKMTPNDALETENKLRAKANVVTQVKNRRTHSELEVGTFVKCSERNTIR